MFPGLRLRRTEHVVAPRLGGAQNPPPMARVVATVASLVLSAQGFVPLVLACCSAPAAHACCSKAIAADIPELPLLSRAPCCTPAPPQAIHREDSVSPDRVSNASPVVVVRPTDVPVYLTSIPPTRRTLPGAVPVLGPPLPLRI